MDQISNNVHTKEADQTDGGLYLPVGYRFTFPSCSNIKKANLLYRTHWIQHSVYILLIFYIGKLSIITSIH